MPGGFYARLRDTREDDDALAACIDRVVKQLEDTSTSGDRPGMLLIWSELSIPLFILRCWFWCWVSWFFAFQR